MKPIQIKGGRLDFRSILDICEGKTSRIMIRADEPSDTDVEILQNLILEMSKTITSLLNDKYLKGLVGSAFDTMKAQDILECLEAYNMHINHAGRVDD